MMQATPRLIKNPLRLTQRRPLDMGRADDLVERLRDARARVRLGIPIRELDALFDQSAAELETAAEIASTVKAHERSWGHGELVWVPKGRIFDVLAMLGNEDE